MADLTKQEYRQILEEELEKIQEKKKEDHAVGGGVSSSSGGTDVQTKGELV